MSWFKKAFKKEYSTEEAREIGNHINIDWDKVDIEQFRMGIGVEMEHGGHDPETDVIGNDVDKAGKIAWAHLKELPDYYTRLKKMESD